MAFVPIFNAPVPQSTTTEVAPVPLPIVTVRSVASEPKVQVVDVMEKGIVGVITSA